MSQRAGLGAGVSGTVSKAADGQSARSATCTWSIVPAGSMIEFTWEEFSSLVTAPQPSTSSSIR